MMLTTVMRPMHREMLEGVGSEMASMGYHLTSFDLVPLLRTFVPDFLCLLCCFLAYYKPQATSSRPTPLSTFLTLTLMYGLTIYHCSWFSFLYLSFAILWSLHIVYTSTPTGRTPYLLLNLICSTQITVSFWYCLPMYFSQIYVVPGSVGLIQPHDYSLWTIVICLYLLSDLYRDNNSDKRQGLEEKLVTIGQEERDSAEISVFKWVLLHTRSAEFMIGITRLLVVFWITRYREFLSVFPLLWLFSSIWLYNRRPWIYRLLNYLLLPAVLLSIFLHYIANIVPFLDISYYSLSPSLNFPLDQTLQLSFFLIILRLSSKLQTVRKSFPQKTDSFKAFLNEIIANFSKLSLTVLFIVGLSGIDLLHTPLLVLCIYFWVDAEAAKRLWGVLLGYTMWVLLVLYLWDLGLAWGVKWEQGVTTAVGLQSEWKLRQHWTWPDQYLLWALLAFEALQKICFEHLRDFSKYELSRTNLLLSCLLRIKTVILVFESRFEIWVLYTLMLLTTWLSDLNILNFFRYLLLIIYLVTHFTDISMRLGQAKVRPYWFIIKYYCGLVLVFRYVFQFARMAGAIDERKDSDTARDLQLLGVELYDPSGLYKAMISDLVLFVSSVLAHKALAHKTEEPVITPYRLRMSEVFAVVTPLGIAVIAMYWRLAGSMFLHVLVSVLYFTVSILHHSNSITTAFTSKTLYPLSSFSLNLRNFTWRVHFFFCILYLVTAYAVFVVKPEYMLPSEFDYAAWILYALGFWEVQHDGFLLNEIIGYVMILCLLIVEKHCLELTRRTHPETVTIQHQLTPDFQLWNHARVLFEELLLLGLLLIAFYKLTVVSILYVAVLVCLCLCGLENMTLLRLLTYVLGFAVVVQYGVLLSNISPQVSTAPYPNITSKPFPIPWYEQIPWRNINTDPAFYSMGTRVAEVQMVSWDVVLLAGVWVYFHYFAGNRPEVALQDPMGMQEGSGKESVWVWMKNFFYVTAHILITLLVLVFVSQSSGLSGLLYCSICLLLLIEATTLLNFSRQWERHITLVKLVFLPVLMLDFLSLIVYQTPTITYYIDIQLNIRQYLGLTSLLQPGEEAVRQFQWVVFKLISFMILRLLSKMYFNADFRTYIREYREKIQFEAEIIRERDTKDFETARETAFARQSQQQTSISLTLMDLLGIVKAWNEQKCDIQSSSERIQQCLNRTRERELKWEQKLLQYMTEWVNTSFFHDTVDAMKKPLPGQEEDPEVVYYPSWGRYLSLMWCIVASRTKEVCYLVFLLNHYHYASMESVVFPLTLLG